MFQPNESNRNLFATQSSLRMQGGTPPTFDEAYYEELTRQTNENYKNQKAADFSSCESDVFKVEALAYYIDHPVEFIEDVFPNPEDPTKRIELEDWQKEACEALVGRFKDAATQEYIERVGVGGYVSIAAGSGVGKSFLLSKIIYWFLSTRKGKVPCTAPTEHQLFDVLWSELKKDYDSVPDLQKIFTWTQTKLFVKGHVATWFAVARTSVARKDGKVSEGLQGFHDLHLLYIVDEASGVPDSSYAAVDGALTGKNAMCILTSNPTRVSGRFYNSHKRTCIAKGGPWHPIRVDCRKSKHVDHKYVMNMLLEHGEQSPIFKAKVSGEFPDQEEAALISLSDFESAVTGIKGFNSDGDVKRIYTAADMIELPERKQVAYESAIYATPEHEMASINFMKRCGFRGAIGRRPQAVASYDINLLH